MLIDKQVFLCTTELSMPASKQSIFSCCKRSFFQRMRFALFCRGKKAPALSSSPTPLPSLPPPELSKEATVCPEQLHQISDAEDSLVPPLPEGTPPPPEGPAPAESDSQAASTSNAQLAVQQSQWKMGALQSGIQNNNLSLGIASGSMAEQEQPRGNSVNNLYSSHPNAREMPAERRRPFWDGGLPSPFAHSAPEEAENPFLNADWAPVEAPSLAS